MIKFGKLIRQPDFYRIGQNAVGITALADIDYYDVHNEQDYQGGAVQAEGRYDIAEQPGLPEQQAISA